MSVRRATAPIAQTGQTARSFSSMYSLETVEKRAQYNTFACGAKISAAAAQEFRVSQ